MVQQKLIQPPPQKEMSHTYSVKQSEEICKILNALRLRIFIRCLSRTCKDHDPLCLTVAKAKLFMEFSNVLLSQAFPHVLDPPLAAHMGELTKYNNVARWSG